MARGYKGIDDYLEERRRELQRMGQLQGGSDKPAVAKPITRNVGMSPAGKRRLGSVGVSSTSRHRNMPQTAAKKRKGR